MHQIRIEGTLFGDKINVYRLLPERWEEFSVEHLIDLAQVLTSEAEPEKYPRMLLYRWLKIENRIFFNLDPAYVEQLCLILDFVLKENTLNKVLMPVIKHENVQLIGPKDSFTNFSFMDWILSENYFTIWQKKKTGNGLDDVNLDKILWCMYRPARKNFSSTHPKFRGDLRELINEYTVDQRSTIFSTLDKKTKMALLMTYIGNRNTVINRFRPVFEYASDKKMSDMYGSLGVIVSMIGDKFGKREELEQANAYEVFISWHQNIERLEEFERQKNEIE